MSPRTVRITSLGTSELLRALESGEVAAGYVDAPYAAQLLAIGRATLLADLRTAAAAAETLDASTVHAAVFGRADRLPAPEALSAFVRALTAAEGRIAAADASDLAARLAPAVSARPDEFAARLAASRGLFLSDPRVSPAQVRASLDIIRERMPLPPFGHLPSPRELVEVPRR